MESCDSFRWVHREKRRRTTTMCKVRLGNGCTCVRQVNANATFLKDNNSTIFYENYLYRLKRQRYKNML